MIGPARARFYALLAFLFVCALLAFPSWVGAAEPKDAAVQEDWYTCHFLGYCPASGASGKARVPHMWAVVRCYDAVGKRCKK